MKGLFIKNCYYTDSGIEYIQTRLTECFAKRGAFLENIQAHLIYGADLKVAVPDCDFVVFWDKDIKLAKAFEDKGIRVFNKSEAIENCDDKEKTFHIISKSRSSALKNLRIPKTLISPLAYKDCQINHSFLDVVVKNFVFPLIAKDNSGSQGKQVFLLNDLNELKKFYDSHYFIPHQYQEFFCSSFGKDIRIYVVGGEVIGSVLRENTMNFKSNISMGAKMSLFNIDNKFKDIASAISNTLKLDFGSVDFLYDESPIFLEANSNAYFKTIESLNIDIADKYVNYIIGELKNGN